MRDYELVVAISPEITDDNLPAIVDKVSRIITDRGGEVKEVQQWGRRRLAYPIKHFREANYILTRIQMEPKIAKDVEAGLQLSEEVIRHLLVLQENRH